MHHYNYVATGDVVSVYIYILKQVQLQARLVLNGQHQCLG
jgi:hypothetical protein